MCNSATCASRNFTQNCFTGFTKASDSCLRQFSCLTILKNFEGIYVFWWSVQMNFCLLCLALSEIQEKFS
jgi:hypothetical protein